MEKIKYINNKVVDGIEYDYTKIVKKFNKILKNKLGDTLKDLYVPQYPYNKADWFVEMSERSVGKTTMVLLLGLVQNSMYGTKIEYIRNKYEQIAPKNSSELWKTIREYDYISDIYDGAYNDIEYQRTTREWHLIKRDEKGEIVEKSIDGVCHMHSLDNVDNTKSVYNSPRGDFCLYDEFIPVNGLTREGDFIALVQLLSTISRQRYSCKFYLMSNTVNKYTDIFRELLISNDIISMKMGDEKIVKSPKGVSLYVHLIKFEGEIAEKRRERNLRFFGFNNPRLNSIIGGNDWETFAFPHVPKGLEYETIIKNIFFDYADKYLQFKICFNKDIGLFGLVSPYTGKRDYDEMRIYCLDDPVTDWRKKYGLGSGNKTERLIERLLKSKRVFYATNTEGNLLNQYLKEINISITK